MHFVAAIESGHLVRASPEREAAFESKRQRGREDRHAAPRIQPTHPMPRGLTEEAGERLAEMKKVLRRPLPAFAHPDAVRGVKPPVGVRTPCR
jgi:hypothetical protein